MSGATAVPIPALVLGGSGYVAGELLRILAGHPAFRVEAVVSASRGEESVVAAFPHLRGTRFDGARFADGAAIERALGAAAQSESPLAVFSALPHGEAAARIAALLALAERAGAEARVVDLSADFRHRSAEHYEELYGRPQGAPERLAEFLCALPEHASGAAPRHVAHPGCFSTAAALALAPLLAQGWLEPRAPIVVTAVTGSTGAGRQPAATTHHPERRSDLFAYAPLAHRHESEMRALLAAVAGSASEPDIAFVPHAGPFARGIHATVTGTLAHRASVEDLRQSFLSFYGSLSSSSLSLTERSSPFVHLLDAPPRLQAVVGTNRCDLALAVRDDRVVVMAAIDNLVKGAAGGAVQWMNRLCGLPAAAGLALPGLGWL